MMYNQLIDSKYAKRDYKTKDTPKQNKNIPILRYFPKL